MAAGPIEIDISLRDIRNFFTEPEIDPFDGEGIDESGMDQLIDIVRAQRNWRGRDVRATLHVPNSPQAGALIPRMGEAMASYCDKHALHAERKLREVRIDGMRALAAGIVFLALCIGLAAGFEKLIGAESLVGRLLVEGAVIAGWVGLWRPIELLLFDWWPYARDLKLYAKLRVMPVEIRTDVPA